MFIDKKSKIGEIDFLRALEIAKEKSYRYIILNTNLGVMHLSNEVDSYNLLHIQYFVYDTLTSELKLKIS